MIPAPVARVLIVDDDAELRRHLANEFRNVRFLVLEAGDGFEADALLERGDIDLVISDAHMPRCDGLELLKKIRVQYPTLPVMLATASADLSDEKAKALGADALVRKPVAFERLIWQVLETLALGQNKRQAHLGG